MTSLNGYIQGLSSGADRIVKKTGKEIKLSVYDNIDRVIVFNEAGETSQKHYDGTFNFNQLIHNGNFEDTSYWKIYTSSRGTISANNNIGTITYNGSYSGGYDCALSPNGYSIPLTSSHKYLLTVSVKSDFTTDIGVEIGTGIGSLDRTLTVGEWTDYSIIAQRPSWSSGTVVLIKPVNSTIVNGSQLQFKNYMFIDLTDMFGSTKADELYAMEQAEAGSGVAWFRSYFPDNYYPYNSGTQTTIPSPLFPEDIKGIGTKQFDGTYRVYIDYDDGDEHYGRITASGLAYPLYEGDILDFVNGKIIRANGYKKFDGSETWADYSDYGLGFQTTISDLLSQTYGNGKSNRFIRATDSAEMTTKTNVVKFGDNNNKVYFAQVNISGVSDLASWKTYLQNNETYIVYPLATPTDEYITLDGDISDIETATVTADGTLTVKYDKVEMAIRKYSSPPDWSKIGYSATPNAVIDAFDYAKRIYDTWSFTKYTSDLNLRIFPNVDISGQLGLNGMFKGCSNLIALPPLTIGTDSGTLNASEFARTSGIEEITITSNNLNQENNFQNGFNGCSFLKEYSITAKVSNCNAMFSGCSRLTEASDFDTSTTTNFSEMFSGCSSLAYISDDFDTSSGTNFYRCFYNCTSLESIPSWNLRNGTNLQQLFAGCSSIKNLPPLVITSATNLTNMFQNSGSNLTELSRNNILMMLATASSYSGTKTLAAVGFTSSMYTAASWQALTNYNDFLTAGWSIGYN